MGKLKNYGRFAMHCYLLEESCMKELCLLTVYVIFVNMRFWMLIICFYNLVVLHKIF